MKSVGGRVADPQSAFISSGSGSSILGWTDPDPIRIQGFNDQKFKKNYSWKFFYIFFISKTAIYLYLGLHKVCPSYRRSLQPSKRTSSTSNMKFLNFLLLLRVSFALLDPDSEYGSGFTDLIPEVNVAFLDRDIRYRPTWIWIQSRFRNNCCKL